MGLACTWDSLGYSHRHLGNLEHSIVCHRNALHLFHKVGDPDTARNAWRHALQGLDELDHPDAGDVRAKLSEVVRGPDEVAKLAELARCRPVAAALLPGLTTRAGSPEDSR